jgi:hypothetical protein
MSVTRIPVRSRKKQVMLCVRLDHFRGECSIYHIDKSHGSAGVLLLRASGTEEHLRGVVLRSESGLPGHRLAYTVHVPADGKVDPRARVVIIVFTKRKVLANGCIELEIPAATLGTILKPLGGYIDFVPTRDEVGSKKKPRG